MARSPKPIVPPKPILKPFTPDPYEDEFFDPNPVPGEPDEVKLKGKAGRVAKMSPKAWEKAKRKAGISD